MGDADNGKVLFVKMCAVCHTVTKDGRHRAGPNLFGVFGRQCGTASGFSYTNSMRTRGITWNEETLNEYLQFPREFIPGTKMIFNGIKKAEDRRDLITYLATLK